MEFLLEAMDLLLLHLPPCCPNLTTWTPSSLLFLLQARKFVASDALFLDAANGSNVGSTSSAMCALFTRTRNLTSALILGAAKVSVVMTISASTCAFTRPLFMPNHGNPKVPAATMSTKITTQQIKMDSRKVTPPTLKALPLQKTVPAHRLQTSSN
jgi:hypothetical protein